jgi:tetratricopeptide (TPR) repeat protein
MAVLTAVVLECPQCGAPVKQGSRTCDRCYSEYIVTSVRGLKKFDDSGVKKYLKAYEAGLRSGGESAELYTAMGICQLRRGLCKHATDCFEKAIALLPEDSETYYYAAVSLLAGKRPFLSALPTIRKAIEYIDLALDFSEHGAYYYLKHLIHKDYFEMKNLRCSPTSAELLNRSQTAGLGDNDILETRELLGMQ